MKKKKLFILLGSITLILILTALPFMAASAKPAPLEIKAVTFVAKGIPVTNLFAMLVDRVNEQAKGELVINWLGGPEVVPLFELGAAVKGGVVDMGWIFLPAYSPLVRVQGLGLSQLTPEEERRPGGAYDFMQEYFKKGGLFYLGRGTVAVNNTHTYLTKRVEKPQDLAGLKMGLGTKSVALYKKLGAINVKVATGEAYTAVERGVIDGFDMPLPDFASYRLYEVAKYCIDHGYYTTNITTIMNLKTWESLPKHLQDLLMGIQIELEGDLAAEWIKLEDKARQLMLENGVEFIKFSPADAEWFTNTACGVMWDELMKKFPETTPRLKELLSK